MTRVCFQVPCIQNMRLAFGVCAVEPVRPQWPRTARYCNTVAAIPPHIGRCFVREVHTPLKWCDTPLVTSLHTGTSVRYAIWQRIARSLRDTFKTSMRLVTKEFCDTIAMKSIAGYEKSRCGVSKSKIVREEGKVSENS